MQKLRRFCFFGRSLELVAIVYPFDLWLALTSISCFGLAWRSGFSESHSAGLVWTLQMTLWYESSGGPDRLSSDWLGSRRCSMHMYYDQHEGTVLLYPPARPELRYQNSGDIGELNERYRVSPFSGRPNPSACERGPQEGIKGGRGKVSHQSTLFYREGGVFSLPVFLQPSVEKVFHF